MQEFGEKNLFQREKKEEKKEEELTPEMRYGLDYTCTAKTLKVLKEHPDFPLSQLLREGRGREMPDLVTIGKLEKLGVIKIENDRVKEINLKNLPPFEELLEGEERATKILELVDESERGVIAMSQIARKLNEPYLGIRREVKKLNSVGLVKKREIPLAGGGLRILVFSASFSEKITTKELNKIIKKIDEEIKGTKEEAQEKK